MSLDSVDETEPGYSAVSVFYTTDEYGDSHTYSLVAGEGDDDNASFDIVDNILLIKESPDFETESTYSYRVQTKDKDGATFEKSFTLNVNDINESPTDLSIIQISFSDSIEAGSTVAILKSSDPDYGDTFTYSFVLGDGDTDNELFAISGSLLKIVDPKSLEVRSNYFVRIQSKDSSGQTFQKSFLFQLNQYDDIAPQAPFSFDLNSASDTGNSQTGNLTSDTTPIVTGKAEAGSTVELFADAISLGSTTTDGGTE